MHKPIHINNLSFSLPHKTCFHDFSTPIYHGNRIAIIGRNGSGKTSLLNLLNGTLQTSDGTIDCDKAIIFGYVPQVIESTDSLSGGQRFHKALTQALSLDPQVLLLDEPTNHLDQQNRKKLMRMLQSYAGTLIIVSHDTELLRHCVNTLWHIDNAQVRIFHGAYDDYIDDLHHHRASVEHTIAHLNKQKKTQHDALMKEQTRAAKRKAKGERSIHQRKWPTIVSVAKMNRAKETTGRIKSAIHDRKQALAEQLDELRLPEIILPSFSISAMDIREQVIISIHDASVGYLNQEPVLQHIYLSIHSNKRIAIEGNNGSGKSTLMKAILDNAQVIKTGHWFAPKQNDIGYLDQHYGTLCPGKTVLASIADYRPDWSHLELRRHLNDFLFRKNEEVYMAMSALSGGEKARLSLAQIAASTPKLLLLDEITNNLDLETKEHVIQVLRAYPGAILCISHDRDFLKAIQVDDFYYIADGALIQKERL